MIKTTSVTVRKDIPATKICDKCAKKVTVDDMIEWQEFYHIRLTGGYGSVFGDTEEVKCDLCQKCLLEMIKDYYRTA